MAYNSESLSHKIAIVTGCSRGIGKAIMLALAQNGAIVYGVARNINDCPESLHDNIIPCCFDIKDKNAIKELILKIKKEHGRLDILINNAGIMQDALIGMITDEQIQTTFETNVFAPIHFIQYASKLMLRQKSGSIINVASIMGISGNSAQMVYSASKGAIIAMTKAAAKELTPHGIRVNAVAPGVISTDLLNNVPDSKMDFFLSRIAAGRLGNPEDVANLILFLSSDESTYISGQILGIDGMMSN